MPHTLNDLFTCLALGICALLFAYGAIGLFATWCAPRMFSTRLYGTGMFGRSNDRRYRALMLGAMALWSAYLAACLLDAGQWKSLLSLGAVVAMLLANRRRAQLTTRRTE